MFHILRISSFLNEIRVISFKQTPMIIRRLHFNSVKRIHCTQKIEKLLSRISIRQIFIPKFKFQRARRHRFENKEARMFIIRAKYNTRTARVSQLISRPTLPDRVVLVAREVVETKFHSTLTTKLALARRTGKKNNKRWYYAGRSGHVRRWKRIITLDLRAIRSPSPLSTAFFSSEMQLLARNGEFLTFEKKNGNGFLSFLLLLFSTSILVVSFLFLDSILKRIKRRNEIFIFHRYRPVYLPMVIIWIFPVTRDILRMNVFFLSLFLF